MHSHHATWNVAVLCVFVKLPHQQSRSWRAALMENYRLDRRRSDEVNLIARETPRKHLSQRAPLSWHRPGPRQADVSGTGAKREFIELRKARFHKVRNGRTELTRRFTFFKLFFYSAVRKFCHEYQCILSATKWRTCCTAGLHTFLTLPVMCVLALK